MYCVAGLRLRIAHIYTIGKDGVVWNYSLDIRHGYDQMMTFWRKSWSYFEQIDFLQAI